MTAWLGTGARPRSDAGATRMEQHDQLGPFT